MVKIARLNVQIGADLTRFRNDMNNALRTLNTTTSQMQRSLQALQGSFRGVGVGVAALAGAISASQVSQFAKDIVQAADAFNQLQAKIKTSLSDASEFDSVFKKLVESSNRAGTSIEATGQAFVRMRPAIQELGASNDQLIHFNETFAKMGALAGATAEEIKFTMIQLSQGIASNRLSGDELKSVMEQMPGIGRYIAEALEVPYSQLKKVAKEGKITADVVFNAILAKTAEVDAQFAKLPPSVNRAVNKMKNSVTEFIGKLNEATGMTDTVAYTIVALSETIDQNSEAWALLSGQLLRTTGVALKTSPIFWNLGDSIERMTEINFNQWMIGAAEGLDVMTTAAQKALLAIDGAKSALHNYGAVWGSNSTTGDLQAMNQSSMQVIAMKEKQLDAEFARRQKDRLWAMSNTMIPTFEPSRPKFKPIKGLPGSGDEKKKKKGRKKKEKDDFREKNQDLILEIEFATRRLFASSKQFIDEFDTTLSGAGELSDELKLKIGNITETMFAGTKDFTKNFEDVQQVIMDTLTPLEKYRLGQQELNYLHEKAGLPTENFKRAMTALDEDLKNATKSGQDYAVAIGNVIAEFGDRFFDTFVDGLKNGKFAFKDFVASALEDLAKLIFKMTVTIPLAQALSDALKGGQGQTPKGNGQVKGAAASTGFNMIGSALFKGIGKLFGLAEGTPYVPSDMVAQLHKGEMVVPATFAEGMRRGDVGMGGGGVTLNQYFTIQAIDRRDFEDRLAEHAKFIGNVSVQALQRQENRMGRRGPMDRG